MEYPVLDYPVLLILPVAMVVAGAMDLLTMTISNRISLALIAGFCVAAPLAGLSPHLMLMHVAAGALVLVIGILMFARGWLGGGDAKLMAAGSLWIGMAQLLNFFYWMAMTGGVLAFIILLYRRTPVPMFAGHPWAEKLHSNESGIPYGIAIAGGALAFYPSTPIFHGLVL
jgi:prepilin peptidase CpaA